MTPHSDLNNLELSEGSFGISVVYPTRDRTELLLKSIKAMLENTILPREIIVIDQGRTNKTRLGIETLNCPCVVYVASEETGVSRARNLGLKRSRYPIVGFLDDDCIPANDWIQNVRKTIIESPESGVWIGEVFHKKGENLNWASINFPIKQFTIKGVNDPWQIAPTGAVGGNIIFRKSLFDAVGMFDPHLGPGAEFPGAEDGDMIYRFLKHNFQVTFSNTIKCHHVDWRNDLEEMLNAYNHGLGVGAMIAKHMEQKDYYPLTVIFPRSFLSRFFAVPYHLFFGQKEKFMIHKKWCKGIVQGYLGWRKKSK